MEKDIYKSDSKIEKYKFTAISSYILYLMPTEDIIKREFDAFKPIRDASPKYVLSLDKVDLSHDGIIHLNIEDFLLRKRDLLLS